MKKIFLRLVGWTGTALIAIGAAVAVVERVFGGVGVVWSRVKETDLYRSLNKKL